MLHRLTHQPPGLAALCTALVAGAVLAAAIAPADPSHASDRSDAHKRAPVTYSADIRPIIAAHCAGCHHEGEVAPFALLSYTDVKKRARQIEEITASRRMPPWKADSHGEFLDENRLSQAEIDQIKQWSEADAPEGERMPDIAGAAGDSEWRLGKPDVVLAPARPYTLAAEGRDEFHEFLLHTNFTEDRWLSAVDVKPGNRKVVHHTILYVDTDGRAHRRAQSAGADDFASPTGAGVPPGVVDIWTPGKLPRRWPDGVGMRVPKGSDLVLEIHYHRSGKPETDLTRAALYFSRAPVKRRLRMVGLAALRLQIPAGDAHYTTEATLQVPENATLYSIFPHMHLIGRQMDVDLTRSDGAKQPLVHVPDWDFNWQNTYLYKDPVKLQRGDSIHMSAVYDNSASNPRNPNSPPRFVTWGEQTTDEMSLVFFGYTIDREDLTAGVSAPDPPSIIARPR